MKFETTRFGEIEVDEEYIVTFPEGPLGFPDCTRFTFVDEDRAVPFRMLQSLDRPSFAFVVVDPLVACPDYKFEITKDDLKKIEASSTEGLQVYCIVTMSRNVQDVTINLMGPFIINEEKKLGCQFVLYGSEYSTREKLIQEKSD